MLEILAAPAVAPDEDPRIRDVVVVGGGTAGWMVAAALGRFLANGHTRIRVVESEEIGTVGVGEATIPPIRSFLQMLRIDESDFMRRTQATFKLGIEFVDWLRPGHRYLHPFGSLGADIEGVPFHQFFLRQRALGHAASLEDYSLTSGAARLGRFGTGGGERFPFNQWAYAYHFDAALVARYLRDYAQRLGVQRTEGRVVQVEVDAPRAQIVALRLQSGERVAGDFFIDCSGFRGLLIGEALGVAYEDWSRWLPCNRAVAVPSDAIRTDQPYTRSTARAAGWQWHIPLQSRTGNGYVYCDQALTQEGATEALLRSIEGRPLGEPRQLRFTTGRRAEFWRGNCLALGLAAGFLEPLESTAIHLVQSGVAKLLALFPERRPAPAEIAEYNRQVGASYQQVRDFLILHYRATERDDSEFWRHCRQIEVPDSLRARLELFEGRGRCFRYEDDLFSVTSWVAVLLGQGRWPSGHDEIVNSMSEPELLEVLGGMRERIRRAAESLPTQADYLARNCRAPTPA